MRRYLKAGFISMVLLLAPIVYAHDSAHSATLDQPDVERRNLALLSEELTFLQRRVQSLHAQSQEQPQGRLRFEYDLLLQDLKAMQAGIHAYIERSIDAGRDLPPLHTHYTADED